MALPRKSNIIPASIGKITVVLTDLDGENENRQAMYRVQVLSDDGAQIDVMRGNLQPHLTPAQINGLLAFMDALRTQAESEILQ